MQSDIDVELEKVVQRAWKFTASSEGIPQRLKAPLGELIEAYIRLAYTKGQKNGIESVCKPS